MIISSDQGAGTEPFQKWLGSLSGVDINRTTITHISSLIFSKERRLLIEN